MTLEHFVYLLSLDCQNAAMDFDVIMEEKFVPKIELGDIVSVVGWLSGKIYL